MRARNTPPESLSFVWDSKLTVRRALFLSYRFNFRWFHDFVLSRLSSKTEITVIASRFGDEDDALQTANPGDLYGIEQWARWHHRLRVRYLPAEPITYHAKFVLLDVEGRSLPILGGGSANLTSCGWSRNTEIWSWDERQALGACRSYLSRIAGMVGQEVVAPWIRRLPKDESQLPWLFGSKRRAREAAWNYLSPPSIGTPQLLTVASPYFDRGSAELLDELLAHVASRLGSSPAVNLLIDGSGHLGRRSDYVEVLALSKRKNVRVLGPARKDSAGEMVFWPSHMKAIELRGNSGARMVFGSANFTKAAWHGGNHETLFRSPVGASLESLWSESQFPKVVDRRRLETLRITAVEDDTASGSQKFIYWATFDESALELIVSASKPNLIAKVQVLASSDPRRFGEEKERLDRIAKQFSESSNWSRLELEGPLVKIKLQQHASRQIPERLRVRAVWLDGTEASSPVEVQNPDFTDLRDAETGMPWDLTTALSGLCTPKQFVATKLTRKSTLDMGGDDEEEIAAEPQPSSLTADFEYHHVPDGVRLARAIAKASPERRREMLRLISLRKSAANDAVSKFLLEASRLALKDE